MSVTRKFTILTLSLFLVLSISLLGCSSSASSSIQGNSQSPAATVSSPTPTLTTQDIISKAITAAKTMNSFNFELGLKTNVAGTINNQIQNVNITANGNGSVDSPGKKLQMTLNMELNLSGQSKITVPVSFYYVDNYVYVQAMGQWTKQRTDYGTSGFDASQAESAVKMLSTAIKVDRVSDETVNGTPSYVFQINPDLSALSDWLKSFQQMTDVQGGELNVDLSKYINELSIKEWIAKDSFYLKKFDISMKINVNQSDIETPAPGITPSANGNDEISVDIAETMTIKDYNQPVNITLPAEAQNAKEIPAVSPPDK